MTNSAQLADPNPETRQGKVEDLAGAWFSERNWRRTYATEGHSEEQIVYALGRVESGKKVSELCREMGVSAQAFYSWKRRYVGLGLNELRELRVRKSKAEKRW